jgi:hypothetical protein
MPEASVINRIGEVIKCSCWNKQCHRRASVEVDHDNVILLLGSPADRYNVHLTRNDALALARALEEAAGIAAGGR